MLKVDLGSHRWPSRWPLAAAAVARVHSSNAVKFEEMESTPEFAALPTARDEEATVPYRQILSHHASTACQPQNDTWPVPSLKACGVDTGLGAAGHWRLTLSLPNSFEDGDGLDIAYVGPEHTKFKQCQTEAAKFVLASLLVNRPRGVCLHQ